MTNLSNKLNAEPLTEASLERMLEELQSAAARGIPITFKPTYFSYSPIVRRHLLLARPTYLKDYPL